MKSKSNRRSFLKKSSKAGMACCALMMSTNFVTASVFRGILEDKKIDPKKLNFCGYTCPADCQFYVATVEDDIEKKKEAYKNWKIKERYGLEFDAETAICWKCKTKDKPLGIAAKNCTVRSCSIEKKLDSCIECDELKSCEKDLWNRFPDFHKAVKDMQVKYQAQLS